MWKNKNSSKGFGLLILVVLAILYSYPLFIIPLLLLIFGYFYFRKNKQTDDSQQPYYPYHKRQYYMSAAEYAFFKVLQEVVKDKYYIVPQVVLSNLVEVDEGYKWNKSWRSKIDKKTIDFVLFNKAGYTPYLAIELDDSSHQREDRIERDDFVENVLQRASIRLVRVKNAYTYNPETLDIILNL